MSSLNINITNYCNNKQDELLIHSKHKADITSSPASNAVEIKAKTIFVHKIRSPQVDEIQAIKKDERTRMKNLGGEKTTFTQTGNLPEGLTNPVTVVLAQLSPGSVA